MNAKSLLEYYRRIADAQYAIARLRRFVLDIAIRGKLVPQDPNDEPASELLKRIAKEKARLVKAGGIRGRDELPELGEGEYPFLVPSTWSWCRLGSLGWTQTGTTPPKAKPEYYGDYIPFIKPGDLYQNYVDYSNEGLSKQGIAESGRIATPGSILMVCIGTIGKCQRIDRECSFNQQVNSLSPFAETDSRYLLAACQSEMFQKAAWAASARTTIAILNKGNWELLAVPLPPLAEQHRIVAKVYELMALCDRLEAAQTEREEARDRLAAMSLGRLNASDPKTFQAAAHFVLEALPALTTRPDQIKHLRQTILNLAVRGKLVPQDPNDKPASELLKRVAKEKERLVNVGEIKKEKPLDPITDANRPFDIPQKWSWVRLDSLSRLITKGSSPKWQGVNYVSADEGILFITSENVGNHELRKLDDLKYVESRFRDIEPRSMLKRGDILMNLVGASIGRTAVYDLDLEANINQAVALIRSVEISEGPLVRYLLQYFNSPTAIDFMLGSRVITAQPNMSLTDAREFPIPLPPLPEQHRIVAKVDELMSLCDRLETGLVAVGETRNSLLDALISETLAPIKDLRHQAAA